MRISSRPRPVLNRSIAALFSTVAFATSVHAANLDWTAGSSIDFLWSNGLNWSGGAAPTGLDDLTFPFVVPNPGSLGTDPRVINSSSGSVAKSLWFKTSYVLSGGDLALGSGGGGNIQVDLGATARLDTTLTGDAGLTKTGYGALILSQANTYTGATAINFGTVAITNAAALGSDPSTVTVTGNQTRGTGGGNLLIGGTYGSGLNFTRNLSVVGGGPSGDGPALVTIGNNTLAGSLTTGATDGTRLGSGFGMTTVSGAVTAGAGRTTQFMGNGNWRITGGITGSAASTVIEKSGNGTMFVEGTNAISGSAELRATAGFLRLASGAGIGLIGGNGGTFELRTDEGSAFSSTRLVMRASSTYFADRAVGGSGLGNTIVFNAASVANNNTTQTFSGRNGYGITLLGAGGLPTGAITIAAGNQATLNNNMNGLLTYNGTVTFSEATNNRTITFGGSGNTLITGGVSFIGGGAHVLGKSGAGTLTLQGTGNYTGGTSISGGILAISEFAAIGGATGNLTLAGGTLNYTGAGETTAKLINLSGTTAGGTILANQTGASPNALIFTAAAFAAVPGAGAKTFTLGGASKLDNEIQGIISENTTTFTTGVTKIGGGTWVLSGQNTYTGATSVTDGVLKLRGSGAIADTSALTFDSNASPTGGGLGAFEYLGTAAGSAETIGNLTVQNGIGTVKVTRTAGATAMTSLTLGTAAINRSTGGAVNFVVDAADGANGIDARIILPGVAASGYIQAWAYFNGSSFASYHGTGATGFVEGVTYDVPSTDALTAGGHNLITQTATITAPATAVKTVKLTGSTILTLGGAQALILNNGANTNGGILVDSGVVEINGNSIHTNGSGELDIRVNGENDVLTISSLLTSGTTGGLMKTGAGTLVIANSGNTINPVIRLDEGTIRLANGGKLGTGVLAIRSGAYDLGGVVGVTSSQLVTHSQLIGAGKVTNSGDADVTLTISDGGGQIFTGIIEDGSTNKIGITKSGSAVQSFTGVNSTYTGVTTLNGGTLTVTRLANIGVASSIGRGTVSTTPTATDNASRIVFSGGALQYTGADTVEINRLFTMAGNGTLDASGTGNATLVFGNTGAILHTGSGARTLTLQGSSTGDNELRSLLGDHVADKLGITKTGAGLWVLRYDDRRHRPVGHVLHRDQRQRRSRRHDRSLRRHHPADRPELRKSRNGDDDHGGQWPSLYRELQREFRPAGHEHLRWRQ